MVVVVLFATAVPAFTQDIDIIYLLKFNAKLNPAFAYEGSTVPGLPSHQEKPCLSGCRFPVNIDRIA